MSSSESNAASHSQEVSSPISIGDGDTLSGSPQVSRFNGSVNDSEFPAAIPPEHSARTLVLCFDGTGDQ
jgi:hypothetical protein